MNPLLNLLAALILSVGALAVFAPRNGFLAASRRRRFLSNRVLQEDALKFIAKRDAAGKPATPVELAGVLDAGIDRTGTILQEMIELGLCVRTPDGVTLTAPGRETAIHLIRAHRLWEFYLAEKTGYGQEEWHERADRREHDLDPGAVETLAETLGFPVFDPDGDPIPGPLGRAPIRHRVPTLADLPVNTLAAIVHIEDEPATFYRQIISEGLVPDEKILVIESDPQRIVIRVHDRYCSFSPLVAANISVRICSEEEREVETRKQEDRSPRYTLAEAPLGESFLVTGIHPSWRGAERNRFLDFGLVSGATVVPEMVSPGGDPRAYRIRDAVIALRDDQAGKIFVRAAAG